MSDLPKVLGHVRTRVSVLFFSSNYDASHMKQPVGVSYSIFLDFSFLSWRKGKGKRNLKLLL